MSTLRRSRILYMLLGGSGVIVPNECPPYTKPDHLDADQDLSTELVRLDHLAVDTNLCEEIIYG